MKLGFTLATLSFGLMMGTGLPHMAAYLPKPTGDMRMMAAGLHYGASALPKPTGDVVLTVSGAITTTNADGSALFDRALLDSLPQHSFTTSTIWTEGPNTYTGILLKDLLAAVGATGATVKATALHDYQISFPTTEIAGDAPLVAYLTDGEPMSVRDKGPLWLIFPFDTNADYRTEETYARSIWQMDRIEVTE